MQAHEAEVATSFASAGGRLLLLRIVVTTPIGVMRHVTGHDALHWDGWNSVTLTEWPSEMEQAVQIHKKNMRYRTLSRLTRSSSLCPTALAGLRM
jgi:hypothetical protein